MSKMYEALKKAQEQGVPVPMEVPEPVVVETAELPRNTPYADSISYPDPSFRREEPMVLVHESPQSHESRDTEGVRHLPIQAVGRAAVIPWKRIG